MSAPRRELRVSARSLPAEHALTLRDLIIHAHLGCLPEERKTRQEVRLTIEFRFREPPRGLLSDELADTVCYKRIADGVREHLETGEYKLIERMAAEAYVLARELAGGDARLAVTVHKVKPPVDALAGGSVYRCGDFPA